MAILKDEAQVLRVHEQGNTSLVLIMLGRRLGQFRIHAKGARRWPKKGFEGGFDLLCRGEIVLFPRASEGLWLYKEWDERGRPRIGKSPESLRAASYLCELAEALTRETAGALPEPGGESDSQQNPNAGLYDHLNHAAAALDRGEPAAHTLLNFTLQALRSEGLLPELDACSHCSRKLRKMTEPVWLSGDGFQCAGCAKDARSEMRVRGTWLTPEAHRALLHIDSTSRPVKISVTAAKQLARAMVLLVHGALEHDLRTLHAAALVIAGG